MSASLYPVHVEATLDPQVSRGLWLVKWLLAIPHYIVLAFLWMAFVLMSVVALVAIVVTGRYPRAIFDFNVGVLRWSWRVSYYSYGALATDRYPPFTLNEVPDYPAHFTVDYPEHLSRGLVLVKWWLLAIPHYLIVAILASGGLYVAWDTSQGNGNEWSLGGGLIGLLALVAAVMLLFTGRYPQQLYDLLLGLNRWVLRVAAYAALMTDDYPPFRLDQGGSDPDAGRLAVPGPTTSPTSGMESRTATMTAPPATMTAPAAPPPPTAPPAPAGATSLTAPPTGGTHWSGGRVVAMVIAGLLFLVSGGLLVSGTVLGVADQGLRDSDGFLMSPRQTLTTSTYAIATEPVTIEGTASDFVPQELFGDVTVRSNTAGAEDVFVGVAETGDVAEYLAGVEHATLVDLEDVDGTSTPVYRESQGAAPSVPPADLDIWAASSTGTGEQQLTWEPASGDWTVVVMNSDGARGVEADVAVGATAPVLGGVVIGLLVAGGVLLVASVTLALLAVYARRQRP